MYQGSGRGSVASIRSTVQQPQRLSVWVRDEEDDKNFELDRDFPITEGRRRRVIWGAHESADSGDYLFLANSTVGKFHPFKNNEQFFHWALSNGLISPSIATKVFLGSAACMLLYFIDQATKWRSGNLDGAFFGAAC